MQAVPIKRCLPSVSILWGIAFGLLTLLCAPHAHAYTWMIRHGYATCTPCHLDPSGGSVLTQYGRTVGGLLLTTDYVNRNAEESEPSAIHDFAFGVIPLPEQLMLGGDTRLLYYSNKLQGVTPRNEFLLMQADMTAGVSWNNVLAGASLGYAAQGAFAASLTRGDDHNLVSRHHWIGYQISESQGLVLRAGRMNLPFGIRDVAHTLFVRENTATRIDSDQQHGVAASWSPGWCHAELMAIVGNFQLRPDEYRERGYSGVFEWFPTSRLGIGASSLVTHRGLDDLFLKEAWRQAHGIFARWATGWEPLVVMGEADYVLRSAKQEFRRRGFAGYLQADLEPLQGLHVVLTGEAENVGVRGTPLSFGAWLSEISVPRPTRRRPS